MTGVLVVQDTGRAGLVHGGHRGRVRGSYGITRSPPPWVADALCCNPVQGAAGGGGPVRETAAHVPARAPGGQEGGLF
jgi:hypothetical protein